MQLRAVVTLGVTGRYAAQATQARAGLELWAEQDGIDLDVRDDQGSPDVALAAYRDFLEGDADILFGPYSSGLVRRVADTVCRAHRLLWNHGGSADDLARPGLVSVLAPASSYLRPLVRLGRRRGVESAVLLRGSGRFAAQVIDGARREADAMGLPARVVDLGSWQAPDSLARQAALIAGTFEEDVDAVRRLRDAGVDVALLGCVAGGIREFGARLGALSEGVLAPVQWVGGDRPVTVGPTAKGFARDFEHRTGMAPDYPAAQAAATGWLAAEATRRGIGVEDMTRWRTTTLLGPFELDPAWRQVGYTPSVIQWREGGFETLHRDWS